MRVDDLAAWITEREHIRDRKEAGLPKPWTDDPILQAYRFCNVHREDDMVTRWITEYWRTPHAEDLDLWYAMVVARLFNKPETLAAMGYPVGVAHSVLKSHVNKLRSSGNSVFSAAYMLTTHGQAIDKVEYTFSEVLAPLWRQRAHVRPMYGDTLAEFHARLVSFQGLGSFIAAQVVADMKYVTPLLEAPDWHTWAASGPGSRRGLNRVCQRDPQTPWKEPAWHATLLELRNALQLKYMIILHAQDLQNCLCEFDKYERVRLGQGRPKQRYDGGAP